jgi:hypothetical protein
MDSKAAPFASLRRTRCRLRYRVRVLLYHSTDEAGRTGIEANGFALSHNFDSPGMVWLSDSKHNALAARLGWWVVVDMPDEVAREYQSYLASGDPHTGNFRMPWEVANTYRPFRFERATSSGNQGGNHQPA